MEGLTSRDALNILIEECEAALCKWKEEPGAKTCNCIFRHLHSSPYPCAFHLSGLVISAILIAIGAVDIENEISYSLFLVAFLLLGYTVFLVAYLRRRIQNQKNLGLERVNSMITYLRNTKDNFGYSAFPEPLTEDMWGQLCIRNGHPVNVPKVLLVRGDVLLLRPGQIVPCYCTTEKGVALSAGSRVEMEMEIDNKTGGFKQLKPIKAVSNESLFTSIVVQCLNRQIKPSRLSQQVQKLFHGLTEFYVILPYTALVFIAVIIRYYNATSESYYGTRFVFSIPALIILPILMPTFPLIFDIIRSWHNKTVCDSLGVACEPSEKELLDIFSRLTGTSVIDKKSILSSANPCIDKVIVVQYNEESYLEAETMGLSSEMQSGGRWKLYFDDPTWEEYLGSLRPIGLNLQLNSCLHNQEYISFLDHLSVISPQVPRTIVAANRRCMCQFPHLLGFDNSSCLQFMQSEPKTLGFYKRQPGEAPLHGLTKHRTPIEMAFCTIHSDVASRHSHISCQGTADVVLDACTHVWNGSSVVPLTARLSRQIRDIYQRNSMTGYCLLLSYRSTDATISEKLTDQFIEVPLAREETYDENVLIRSLSTDQILHNIQKEDKVLETAEDLIENILSGHILCGLVAMQYEALPTATQLVDSLESNCIRFVYFSRENELRSRVFAEKLGLEAGWNCHISLAEPTDEKETNRPLHDVFLLMTKNELQQGDLKKSLLSKQAFQVMSKKAKFRSESYLIDEPENKNRKSPFRRQSSMCSLKVGAMPNKAQLPAGVSRVRPHLEEVDNVPLLVGLFTDCDPEVNLEMLTIMQENGEVVLTIGSSLNIVNVPMLLQSDLSVTVRPHCDPNCSYLTRQPGIATANDLAARILSTAADFELSHAQLLNVSATVTGSRHRLSSTKASFIFLMMASIQLSLLLLLSALVLLPLIFTTAQVLITVFLQLPLLFMATVWTPFIPQNTIIRIASKAEKTSVFPYIFCFIVQFFPTIVVLLGTFFISLADNATLLCAYSDVVCSFGDDIKMSTEEIRHIVGLHFVFYLITNSIAWVHPLSLFCWQLAILSPPWILGSSLCLFIQVSYSYLSGIYLHRLFSWISFLLTLSWAIILFIINEICKLRNIRTFLREQRRTKLAFDTKLGMNSPY